MAGKRTFGIVLCCVDSRYFKVEITGTEFISQGMAYQYVAKCFKVEITDSEYINLSHGVLHIVIQYVQKCVELYTCSSLVGGSAI